MNKLISEIIVISIKKLIKILYKHFDKLFLI